jgi:DNA mismatch repair ATPase MutS
MTKKETPLMKQYNTIKKKYPDALLLFRVGDFYETFGEDAIRAAGILNITLSRFSASLFKYLFAKISNGWLSCCNL